MGLMGSIIKKTSKIYITKTYTFDILAFDIRDQFLKWFELKLLVGY